jgi:hypothetical protein
MIPIVAIGLAAALQGLRSVLADRRALGVGFDVAAYLAAAAILISGLGRDAVPYPFPGAKPAAEFVESQLGRDDALLIPARAEWSFARESSFASEVLPTPDTTIGFGPIWSDPRIHFVDSPVDPSIVSGAVTGADRVLVYYSQVTDSVQSEISKELDTTLPDLGFAKQRTATFDYGQVQIWQGRGAGKITHSGQGSAAGKIDLRTSDLPASWEAGSPLATRPLASVFACLNVPRAQTSRAAVFTTATPGQLAISEVTKSPSAAAARDALKALRRPAAAGCIESATRSTMQRIGFRPLATAKQVRPPPAGGNPAVAYQETVRVAKGNTRFGQGTVVFFTHGKLGVMVAGLGLANQSIPSNLLASIVSAVAQRLNSDTQGAR